VSNMPWLMFPLFPIAVALYVLANIGLILAIAWHVSTLSSRRKTALALDQIDQKTIIKRKIFQQYLIDV